MKVVFLHFPKTAGVAVRNAVARCHPELRILPATDMVDIARFSPADLATFDVLAGHFDWSYLDAVPGPRFTFTILREPRARVLSQYRYLRAVGASLSPQLHPNAFRAATLAPEDYFFGGDALHRDLVRDNFDNLYSHYLFHRGYRGQQFARRAGISSSRVLEQAREHLEQLDLVIALPTLPAGLLAVERATGLRFAHDLRPENETPGTVAAAGLAFFQDARWGALLDEFCALDAVLYREVMSRT